MTSKYNKLKDIRIYTYHNQNVKRQRKKETLESRKREVIHHTERDPV